MGGARISLIWEIGEIVGITLNGNSRFFTLIAGNQILPTSSHPKPYSKPSFDATPDSQNLEVVHMDPQLNLMRLDALTCPTSCSPDGCLTASGSTNLYLIFCDSRVYKRTTILLAQAALVTNPAWQTPHSSGMDRVARFTGTTL